MKTLSFGHWALSIGLWAFVLLAQPLSKLSGWLVVGLAAVCGPSWREVPSAISELFRPMRRVVARWAERGRPSLARHQRAAMTDASIASLLAARTAYLYFIDVAKAVTVAWVASAKAVPCVRQVAGVAPVPRVFGARLALAPSGSVFAGMMTRAAVACFDARAVCVHVSILALLLAQPLSAQSPILIYSPNPNAPTSPSSVDGKVLLVAISASPRVDFYVGGLFLASAFPQTTLPSPAAANLKPGSSFFAVEWKPTTGLPATITAYACASAKACTGINRLAASTIYNVTPVLP